MPKLTKKISSAKIKLISIIICVYNESKTLPACLDSLLKLDYTNYELIMVNDASTDNTLEIMRKYAKKDKRIKVVTYNQNKGVPGARNEGMKIAKGEVFVFSDGDCTFYPSWPSHLMQALANPKVGAAGGRDKSPPHEPLIKQCIDYTMTSFLGTAGLRGSKTRLAKYSVTGCNFAVRRDVVDKVGMHNEKIRWRGEEKEWCQRMRNAGYDIKFVPESFVLHYRRISLKSFWNQTYKSGQARFDIIKASPKALEFIHFAPSVFIVFLLLSGIFSLISLKSFYLFLGGLAGYLAVLLIQAIVGSIKVNNLAAFFLIPITTVVIHLAYGLGLLKKLVG
ncbi:MAG TPA: glycosyltransferase [Candidatus Nanoarchaeia archaeon]|nr:glycosyltransferase [Candidatus Nanoarchaeia archaeon]